MERLTGRAYYGLPAALGHAPVVAVEDRCDGSYICECSKCREEVRALMARRAA